MSDCQSSYVATPTPFQDPEEELLPLYMDDEYDDDVFQFDDIPSQFQTPYVSLNVDEQCPPLTTYNCLRHFA